MSLADEFLADLDYEEAPDANEEEATEAQETLGSISGNQNGKRNHMEVDGAELDIDNDDGGADEDMDDVADEEDELLKRMLDSVKSADNAKDVAKLMDSTDMKQVLSGIERYGSQGDKDKRAISGMVEDDPEYQLIVKANLIAVQIDTELLLVHKFIRDHYEPKFPELERLVLNPLDYARAVKRIANAEDITKVELNDILPSATVMVVVVTGTTTEGRQLTDKEWKVCEDACDLMFRLENAKATILDYVESRMTFIAPNLSAIIGTATAAKLMGQAGGLSALSKIPACNIQLLGKSHSTNTALSSASNVKHVGFVYYSPIVQRLPSDLRKKAMRMLGAKLALAARIDRERSFTDGSYGRRLHDEAEAKFEKWQEPPPQKKIKALPAPIEQSKKKRGGRRARKEKEMYAISELQKLKNRVHFGVAEEEVQGYEESEGLGMLGQGGGDVGTGRIRVAQENNRRKGKVSNRTQERLARYGSNAGGTQTAGTASSIAFTPVQGIELVDPTAQLARVKAANEKYFGNLQFHNVGSKPGDKKKP
ncbi:U4/U6 small nuclear ribonucleoprotein Prp31 [Actinomortierella ambigua]|uniref:U4/U6 small nuclear ribonucleoprotein Prp31 n=1 Tax=Actinomortierella ambigua TaxID=1343610 RepID=A0A9P6PYQ7_9FUNG|nr:U4/U6 small nuclear ribonucleoprotein Prp31 [Actinomortierella ambigua]